MAGQHDGFPESVFSWVSSIAPGTSVSQLGDLTESEAAAIVDYMGAREVWGNAKSAGIPVESVRTGQYAHDADGNFTTSGREATAASVRDR